MDHGRNTIIRHTVFFVVGLTMTIIGANHLVTHGEVIAHSFCVPDVIISLTLTALGSSLPELVTAIAAIGKGAHDISIGNVSGANVLNIVLVLGLSSTIEPIKTTPGYFALHISLFFLIGGLIVLFSLVNKKELKRCNGLIIMLSYANHLYLMHS